MVLMTLTAVTPETATIVPTVWLTGMLAMTVCDAPSQTSTPDMPDEPVVDPGVIETRTVPSTVETIDTSAPVMDTTGMAEMLTGPLTTTKTLVPVTETTPETATESATRTTRPKTLAASDAVEPCSAWFAPAVVPVIETATPTEAPETVPAVLTVSVVGEIVTVPLTTAETEAPCWIVTEAPVTVPAVLTVTVPDTRTVPRTVATVKLVATDTRIVPSTVAIVAAVARVTICVPRIVSTVMAVATLTRTVPSTVSTVLMSMTPPDTWTVPEIRAVTDAPATVAAVLTVSVVGALVTVPETCATTETPWTWSTVPVMIRTPAGVTFRGMTAVPLIQATPARPRRLT